MAPVGRNTNAGEAMVGSLDIDLEVCKLGSVRYGTSSYIYNVVGRGARWGFGTAGVLFLSYVSGTGGLTQLEMAI
jgi:hypothetical protein